MAALPAVHKVARYYATFIPGLQEIILQTVRERLSDVEIIKLLDGAILFETQCAYDQFNFFCFNNIFACIDLMEQTSETDTLNTHVRAFVKSADVTNAAAVDIISHNTKKFRTFRIIASQENKPAALDEKLRAQAEATIARISGLRVNRGGADAEFWFLYRSEGFSVFMKRLSLRTSWEKTLHPGELPTPLAWILCRMGNLKHGDTVLDPCCGYGSIPHVALKQFHITKFIACDNNKEAAAYTAARFKKNTGSSFILHKTDFQSLPTLLPPNSIDAIITDPPWGVYQNDKISIPALYAEMFAVFDVLLTESGRIVVLSARTDILLQAAQNRFVMTQHIPILLSGKKTGIFLFVRKPASTSC